jgi:hypothetical protein
MSSRSTRAASPQSGNRTYAIQAPPGGGATTTHVLNCPATSNRISSVTVGTPTGTAVRTFTHDGAGNITQNLRFPGQDFLFETGLAQNAARCTDRPDDPRRSPAGRPRSGRADPPGPTGIDGSMPVPHGTGSALC